MVTPTFADYVGLLFTLFERFWQHECARPHRGYPFVYEQKALIVFFVVMQQYRTFRFKAQRRWLLHHPELCQAFGLDAVPARTTLSRRYKALYEGLQDFIAFIGHYAEDLDARFTSQDLYTDKSLFKAHGSVWHQSDRIAGRIPEHLRHLDTDGAWSKSGYHGWVYGYGLHLVDNRVGFPKMVHVETASVSEKIVMGRQAEPLINTFHPATVTTDNSYAQAMRIRQWATRGVVLLSPAVKWTKGCYAHAKHLNTRDGVYMMNCAHPSDSSLEPSGMKHSTVPATLDSLGIVAEFVMVAAVSAGLDKRASYRLRLAVDEIATNIIVHGYAEAGLQGALELFAEVDDRTLTFLIEDTGAAFDPHQASVPETDLPLEQRPIGGLGVYLAIRSVDEFLYERIGDRNRTILKMHRSSDPVEESGRA
jgi:serine/threonine-protein kinase RsbW